MPRAKSNAAPSVPGETPTLTTTEAQTGEQIGAVAGDAFQARSTKLDDDTAGADTTGEDQRDAQIAALQAQIAAQNEAMANMQAIVANLARGAAPAQAATEDALPDLSDIDVRAYYAGDSTTPVLTKQGWLTHPKAGRIANAPAL